MNGKRQKTRSSQQPLRLAFVAEGRDESPDDRHAGTVPNAANSMTQSLTSSDRLMERICGPLNLKPKFNQPNRRGTDPYARWCGRRETVRSPPIPIALRSVTKAMLATLPAFPQAFQ